MPRMNILNAVEREAFDSPPVFNSFQRKARGGPWLGGCLAAPQPARRV